MSNYFQILSDVTCDLSEELLKEYDIGYIPGHVLLPDGREVASVLEWGAYGSFSNGSAEGFYASLMKNPDGFKTSPCNVQEIYAVLLKYAQEGHGVLMTCISSGMSGTYAFACQARSLVLETIPDAQIRIVDSRRFSICNGLMCIHASQMRSQGKTLDETADFLEENRLSFRQIGWHDNLSFVAKKGRITHSTAYIGRLMGIKTLGECSSSGMTTVIGKVKGSTKAYRAIMEYFSQTVINPSEQVILIGQTDRRAQAEELRKMIEERFHPKAVFICEVFPACGVNIGPGLLAAYYVGSQVTEDLVAEKEMIADILGRI